MSSYFKYIYIYINAIYMHRFPSPFHIHKVEGPQHCTDILQLYQPCRWCTKKVYREPCFLSLSLCNSITIGSPFPPQVQYVCVFSSLFLWLCYSRIPPGVQCMISMIRNDDSWWYRGAVALARVPAASFPRSEHGSVGESIAVWGKSNGNLIIIHINLCIYIYIYF